MEALFLKLVNMSITASWLVLAIIAVRLIFKKSPKWILCLLWGLVAIRLICPFSIESALSLVPTSEPLPQEIIYTASPQIHSGVTVIDDVVNPILESSLTPTEPASANPTQIWSFILSQVWLLGMVLMLLYTLVSYLLLKRKVATAIPLKRGIKQSEFVDSPFVLGIFRPVIYLPFDMAEGDRAYVIAHERAHVRRRDHWWKPFGFLLLSIYWFNPVLWIAYILLCRDIEAACDEKVIRDMEKDDRRAYSTALLNCSIHRRAMTACPLAFGETGVKGRVKSVMNYKKPTFWVIVLSLILSVALAVGFLTNPEDRFDPDKVYPQSVLTEPDRIKVHVSGTPCIYEKDSAEYRSIVEALRVNWWKYTEDDADLASSADLVVPIAPELLKTTSWKTYVDNSDTIICFQYTSEPVIWENADGEEISIETIGFVLPEKTWSEENTKGFFLISQTENIGINEGIYTYYYPAPIANNFWGFVQDARLNEVTQVPGKTLTLNDVIMLSEHGENITMSHLEGYAYEVQGSDLLYTRKYPINDQWFLRVHHGGGLEKPIAVWLTNAETKKHVDITQGNEDGAIIDFIGDRGYTGVVTNSSSVPTETIPETLPFEFQLPDGYTLTPKSDNEISIIQNGQAIGGIIRTDLDVNCITDSECTHIREYIKSFASPPQFAEYIKMYFDGVSYISLTISDYETGPVSDQCHTLFNQDAVCFDYWVDNALVTDEERGSIFHSILGK